MMQLPVYLDNHATTRVDPRVVEAMLPYLGDRYGNPASVQHEYGWVAEAALTVARARVAELIGARSEEIVFVSGTTESVNLALKGVAEAYASKGKHIITVASEHAAVLDTCRRLERYGYEITMLPVDGCGQVSVDDVERAMTRSTILVSVMIANNEIGTLQPVEEIGRLCASRGILFHSDAAQAVGKIPVDVSRIPVDLMSFSAHKMYGPKGIGALYIRAKTPRTLLAPQIEGGGQEGGLRSGTMNVPAIAGFGKAAEIAGREMDDDARRTLRLRERLVHSLQQGLEGIRVNGHPDRRLPHNANITFSGAKADAIMMGMKDVAVSSASACSTASPEPSHVLRAIGLPDEEIRCTLRFGLGRFTTAEEIDYAGGRIIEAVHAVRERGLVAAG